MNEEYVYIFYSRSLPHVVKIGYSNDCLDRVKSMNTGLPFMFKVVKKWKVINAHKLEKEIHRQLDFCRISSNREFFGISPKKAIEIIQSIIDNGVYDLYFKNEVGTLSFIDDISLLGKFIRNERTRQGLTQKQIALTCGIGLRVIGEIENGKQTAQIGIIFKILSILRIRCFCEIK